MFPLTEHRVYIDGVYVGNVADWDIDSEYVEGWDLTSTPLDISRRLRLTIPIRNKFSFGRPPWDEYFLNIAEAVSTRGDCSRRKVGAVVVDKDNRIVSTGYNGSYPGGPSCLQGECPRAKSDVPPLSHYDSGPGACIASHAEANALLYAGRAGTKGSILYITCKPCDGCLKLIKAAGIKKVIWPDGQMGKKDLYGD